MRSNVSLMASAFLACGLYGCAAQGGLSSRQTTGAGIGCLAGAILGMAITHDRAAGAALGCAAGGAVGLTVGSALDERERRELAAASIRAATARTGERVSWGPAVEVAAAQQPTKHRKKSKKGKAVAGADWVTPAKSTTAAADPNAASGWVIPVGDTYVASNGQTCRDLHQVANKGGKTYESDIQACKSAEGWAIPQA